LERWSWPSRPRIAERKKKKRCISSIAKGKKKGGEVGGKCASKSVAFQQPGKRFSAAGEERGKGGRPCRREEKDLFLGGNPGAKGRPLCPLGGGGGGGKRRGQFLFAAWVREERVDLLFSQ